MQIPVFLTIRIYVFKPLMFSHQLSAKLFIVSAAGNDFKASGFNFIDKAVELVNPAAVIS